MPHDSSRNSQPRSNDFNDLTATSAVAVTLRGAFLRGQSGAMWRTASQVAKARSPPAGAWPDLPGTGPSAPLLAGRGQDRDVAGAGLLGDRHDVDRRAQEDALVAADQQGLR